MIHYKTANVAGTASVESSTDLLKGTQKEPKFVRGLWFTEYTAAEEKDALIRVYKDTVKIAEFDIRHTLLSFDSDSRQFVPRIPLEIDLAPGETLEVGHLSGGTASDIVYTVEYEIGRG